MSAGTPGVAAMGEIEVATARRAGAGVGEGGCGHSGAAELEPCRRGEVEAPAAVHAPPRRGIEAVRHFRSHFVAARPDARTEVGADALRGDRREIAQRAQRGARRAGDQPAPARMHGGDRAGGHEQDGHAVRRRDRERESRSAGDEGVAGLVVAG